jgi:hypothetical protein
VAVALTQDARARLTRHRYDPRLVPDILCCSECDSADTVHLTWDVSDDQWQLHCQCCGYTSARAYTDAGDAIAYWNREQAQLAANHDAD